MVAGLLAAEGGTDRPVTDVLVSIAGTLVVFWLAHAYSQVLARSIAAPTAAPARAPAAAPSDAPIGLRLILRQEWPIVESGVLPALGLVLARAAGTSHGTAAVIALIVAVGELGGWAVLACRRASLSAGSQALYALAAGLLGLAIIALKVTVIGPR